MKRLWLYLVGLLLLASCSNEVPEPDVPQLEKRTMLAYLVSNNAGGNLDKYLKYNVVDMYKGLSQRKERATLLVYYRPRKSDGSLDGPSILKFVADGKGKINGQEPIASSELGVEGDFNNIQEIAGLVMKQAEVTMFGTNDEVATDPEVMTGALQKMVAMVPSESYGLTMGSHGTGWLKAPHAVGRSFGDDGGYSINIPELANALKAAFGGQKLEFLMFDACMMANAEVAYELREVTHHLIASVLETPVHGFPYSRFFNELYSEKVNYQEICDQFIGFNRQMSTWGTCAVVDCNQMQKLADWIKVHLAANAEGLTPELTDEVFQYGASSFYKYSFDVVDVFRQLEGKEPVELQQIMNEVVIAKNCLEGNQYEFGGIVIDKDRFCGIGMYLPYLVHKEQWDAYYMNALAWPKAIEWNYK